MISKNTEYDEVQSKIYNPALLPIAFVATVFLLIGLIGCLIPPETTKTHPHFERMFFAVFALFGLGSLLSVAWSMWPVRIRHASRNSRSNIPQEPIIIENMPLLDAVSFELVKDSAGWKLIPCASQVRSMKRFLFVFGVPFLIFFAGLLSWSIYRDVSQNWTVAVLLGFSLTTICGGIAITLTSFFSKDLPLVAKPAGSQQCS
jgi:hypothetical protein